jgi:hypothetical protein
MLHYLLKKRALLYLSKMCLEALPGVSKWAGSLGGEYTKSAKFF